MTLTVEFGELSQMDAEQTDGPVVSRLPFVLRPEPAQGQRSELAQGQQEVSTDDSMGSTFHMPVPSSSTTTRRGSWVPRPIVKSRTRREPNRQFKALARWEGAVVEVFATYFVAEVVDLDNDERAAVEFDIGEISESDRPLCQPGGLFYWSVGYDIKESGQLSRASVIRFRRLGPGMNVA